MLLPENANHPFYHFSSLQLVTSCTSVSCHISHIAALRSCGDWCRQYVLVPCFVQPPLRDKLPPSRCFSGNLYALNVIRSDSIERPSYLHDDYQ